MKKIILEEIDRINELMNTQPKMINEQPKLLSRVGDELWNFVRKSSGEVTQDELDKIVLKGRRDGVETLSSKELKKLMKNLDLSSLARKYYDDGLVISKGTLNSTVQNSIDKIEKEGVEVYEDVMEGFDTAARQDFFGLIPNFKPEYYEFADYFAKRLREDIKKQLQSQKPELWNEIKKYLKIKNFKGTPDVLKRFIDDLSPENVQTIARILVRGRTKGDKLREEFIKVMQDMANSILLDKTTPYYEKKLTDILSATKKVSSDSIRNAYRTLKKNPNFPDGQVVRDFETSQSYTDLLKVIEQNPTWAKIIREDLNDWIQLFNFSKIFKTEFWNGWWNLILKGNPVTFEKIAQRLQQKGLKPYFISQVINAYILKFLVLPALYTLVKTLIQVFGEGSQWVASLVGIETPWNPKEKGEYWSDMMKETFMSAIPRNFKIILPWNSFIDEIYTAAINNDATSAETFIDKNVRPDIIDGANKIKEGKIDEIKEILIEDDLKDLLPQEFHQYLGRNIDGTYELKNPRKGTTHKIKKVLGVWSIWAVSDGIKDYFPLTEKEVMEFLKKDMGG
jgi:hypothetical protein